MSMESFYERIATKAVERRKAENAGMEEALASRMASRGVSVKAKRKKTHCHNGHLRTPENVGVTGACRTCVREWVKRSRVQEETSGPLMSRDYRYETRKPAGGYRKNHAGLLKRRYS